MSCPSPTDMQDSSELQCTCSSSPTDKPPLDNISEVIHSHCITNHMHHPIQSVTVHVHSSPKATKPSCTCHLTQDIEQTNEDASSGLPTTTTPPVVLRKIEADDRIEVSPLPPALPPRPPPRQRFDGGPHGTLNSRCRTMGNPNGGGGIRKYVFWCCACGGLATILGALFLAVYFLLRSYTSTLGYFETIPTFVPATMLILTGLCVMSLARRKNRYSYLIKVCGLCCLVCALTCVLVTITTTVIHMNRLQTLRECVYTQKTRTCTCYSVLLEAHANTDDGIRYVFDSTPDCEVIHGALYSCLRAMFGLSVSGILVCIFSCMLVYQLLSHEKKKMYWEQLELRCRSFYQQHSTGSASNHGSVRGPPNPASSTTYCSCCEECRYPTLPTGPQVYPWDAHASSERFWAPGRIGNFYSPNPGEELAPNPANHRVSRSAWSWRRLPWSTPRTTDQQRDNSLTYEATPSSADSQYGFSNRSGDQFIPDPISGSTGSYSILDNRPPVGGVYVWGPPPPYSNPNSPARRPIQSPGRYHHIHHHVHGHESHCQMNEAQFRGRLRPHTTNKDNYENTTEPEVHQADCSESTTDTSSCVDQRLAHHTLPVRKMKKRTDLTAKNQPEITKPEEHDYQEPEASKDSNQCRFLPRLQGVENAAFQKQEPTSSSNGVSNNNNSTNKAETTESEVYFADVSSCCNISVRNDGPDSSSLYDETLENPSLDEEYLAARLAARQHSTRSRLPLPLPGATSESCLQLLPKDPSQNSLCSSVQTPLTETTDDALTPTEQFLAPDAQYEVISEQESFRSNLTSTISGLNNFDSNYYPNNYNKSAQATSKALPVNRRNIGSNISALIQNLGGNAAGLLYGEGADDEDEEDTQRQTNSDATIDSGWQSGSDKTNPLGLVPEQQQPHKSVNV